MRGKCLLNPTILSNSKSSGDRVILVFQGIHNSETVGSRYLLKWKIKT